MGVEATAGAIINGTVVLPDRLLRNAAVVWEDGRISSVGCTPEIPPGVRPIDAEGHLISPGFIDLHVHGGGGADFMDGTVASVITACSAHLRHGTTTIFPTTTTGDEQLLLDMLDSCHTAAAQFAACPGTGPWIPGIHLYGPYFAAGKQGCHDPAGCRAPDPEEYRKYLSSNFVRIATCAAELPGAEDFSRIFHDAGCLVTCGHSNASWTEMQKVHDAGMRHVDHFWCAMSSVPAMRQRFGPPMQGSMAEFVLMHREMSTEVIADGCHLAPELLEFAWRMKGSDRLCLVTDCNRALDLPPGEYKFGHHELGTTFRSDGRTGWAAPDSLASSVQGMDFMVRHMRQVTTAPLHEVIRMATATPAERAGIQDQTGRVECGLQADLLILDDDLQVLRVIAQGVSASGPEH